jgi:hypothetical protein
MHDRINSLISTFLFFVPEFFFYYLVVLNRYITCLGGVFAKKYQSQDEKFPDPKCEGNLVSRLVFFANTPPNMIYLFNYTEY